MDESTIELNFSADGDEHGVRQARHQAKRPATVLDPWLSRALQHFEHRHVRAAASSKPVSRACRAAYWVFRLVQRRVFLPFAQASCRTQN